jgi:hypothetical protein
MKHGNFENFHHLDEITSDQFIQWKQKFVIMLLLETLKTVIEEIILNCLVAEVWVRRLYSVPVEHVSDTGKRRAWYMS